MRIIIADDQKHARSGLRALLSASLRSPMIWEATTGIEADRLAAEVAPDVILMDVRMPGLDGLAATRRIKSRQPGVKVIVMSLDASSGAEAIAAGADGFIAKGEDPNRLLGILSELGVPERCSGRSAALGL